MDLLQLGLGGAAELYERDAFSEDEREGTIGETL